MRKGVRTAFAVLLSLTVLSSTFDTLDRRTGIDYSDSTPDVTFAYDSAGNRTVMVDGGGTETSIYDDAGRLLRVTRATDVFAYEYDDAGNIIKRTYPDGTQVTLAYDDDNRLASVTHGATTSVYGYDEAANHTLVQHGNGTEEARAYDRAGRLGEVRHRRSGVTFALATYTRDAVGNPTQVVTTDGPVSYDYDDLDRLIEACFTATCGGLAPDGGDAFVRYTNDAVGNRLTQIRPLGTTTYTYNAADQLTQEQAPTGTTTYGYDPNGNLIAAGGRTYGYDLADRLVGAEQLDGTFTYSYDGDGRRRQAVQTSPVAKTTSYAWDRSMPVAQLVVERDAVGALIRRHVHGIDLATTTSPDPLNPALTRTVTVHGDGIGSVLAVTDAAGATDWRYTYDPYGEARREARDDLLAAENRMRFAGELFDVETGLYHLRARQYHAPTGRFLSRDPIERAPGEPFGGTYLYADDRPTVLVDPAGQRAEQPLQNFAPPPVSANVGATTTTVCSANPALCVGAAGTLAGYGFYRWDPFNYSDVVERWGEALYDWFSADSAEPADPPTPDPSQSPDPPPPAPQTTLDRPSEGMLVYRVYGASGFGEFGASWTPIDPRSIGRADYRDRAGLPDSNPGTDLVIGELKDARAVSQVGPARPCGPPHCRRYRSGGLLEYTIPGNATAVVNRRYITLNPPY